jgi:hypothetical protein
MTLTYALIADGGIVLAADSKLTYTHAPTAEYSGNPFTAATYDTLVSKIHKFPNGSALSVAGKHGLVEMLLNSAQAKGVGQSHSFVQSVLDYRRHFQDEYLKLYDDDRGDHPHCDFIFVGYEGKGEARSPLLCKLSSKQHFSFHPSETFEFSGRENHGAALYLHHRLAFPNMPLGAAKQLVYCVLAEVSDLDNMCGRPIEMVVVMPTGTVDITQVELDGYEEKRGQIAGALQEAFGFPRLSTQSQKI